jgi:hypothetical protein
LLVPLAGVLEASKSFRVRVHAGPGPPADRILRLLPKSADDKRESGGGPRRNRAQKGLELDSRPPTILREGVNEEVITRLEALRQLNISDSQLDDTHG